MAIQPIKTGDSNMAQTIDNNFKEIGTRIESKSFQIGYGKSANLQRIGNIVFITSFSTFTGGRTGSTSWTTLSEKIPDGYKPSIPTTIIGFGLSASTFRVHWELSTNGTIRFYCTDTLLAGSYANIPAYSWITDDPFPTT